MVLHVVHRTLTRAPLRTILSAGIAGIVLGLILVFEGFRVGIVRSLQEFPSSLPADLVLLEHGVSDFAASRSSIPQITRKEVEAIAGVQRVHPIASLPVILDTRGQRTPIRLIVHETAGGPRRLVEGVACRKPEDLVLDARVAHSHGLHVGETVEILSHPFRLVGLSAGTGSPFAPYGFITYDGLLDAYFASRLALAPGQVALLSALLVETAPAELASAVRRRIEERVDAVTVFTPAELGLADARMGYDLLKPALRLLLAIAWVIAFLSMSLLLHSLALGRMREFGIQKALGVPGSRIALELWSEALVLTVLGVPVALLASRLTAAAVASFTPLYTVFPWEPAVVLRASAAMLVAGGLGTLVPLRRILTLEADHVFRGPS